MTSTQVGNFFTPLCPQNLYYLAANLQHFWTPSPFNVDVIYGSPKAEKMNMKSDKEKSKTKKTGNEGNQSTAYLHSHGHGRSLPSLLVYLGGLCSLRLIQFVNSPFDKVNLSRLRRRWRRRRRKRRGRTQEHKSCLNIGQIL